MRSIVLPSRKMRSLVLLVLLIAISWRVSEANPKPARTQHWEYLALAQFWPPTSCYFYFGKVDCKRIPADINGFTLHGLWPSGPGSHGPSHCNDSDPFDYNKIKSMEEQLLVQWRNYNTSEAETHLWNHEWTKHGTCAETLPALRGIYNYFNLTLGLHKKLDILRILSKNKLTPSNSKIYTMQEFSNAVYAEFKVKPRFSCEHKDGKHYLEQVCLCYDKTLKMIDCPDDVLRGSRNSLFLF